MLFNNKARFKNNYLVTALGASIRKIYARKEYDIYNDLRAIYDSNGKLTEDEIQEAIRNFRNDVAKSLFAVVDNEYKGAAEEANAIFAALYQDNYENMQTEGMSISCAYITAAKCVLGDDAEGINIGEIASPLIDGFEELEKKDIEGSLEILRDDGIIK